MNEDDPVSYKRENKNVWNSLKNIDMSQLSCYDEDCLVSTYWIDDFGDVETYSCQQGKHQSWEFKLKISEKINNSRIKGYFSQFQEGHYKTQRLEMMLE